MLRGEAPRETPDLYCEEAPTVAWSPSHVVSARAKERVSDDEHKAGFLATAHGEHYRQLTPMLVVKLGGDVRDVRELYKLSKYAALPRSFAVVLLGGRATDGLDQVI